MMRTAGAIALILSAMPGAGAAGEREDACRAQARQLSGYRPPLFEGQAGKLKYRLSGSVAVGISSRSGPADPPAPPFAGAASIERQETERQKETAELYKRLYEGCMGE